MRLTKSLVLLSDNLTSFHNPLSTTMYDVATVMLSVSPEDTRPGKLFVETVRDPVFVLRLLKGLLAVIKL